MTADPTDLQRDASKLLTSAHRLRWVTIAAVMVMLSISVVFLSVLAFQQHTQIDYLKLLAAKQAKQLDSSCSFYRDLGTVPLPVSVKLTVNGSKPSELGVRLVLHSRYAYTGQGCHGALPGPSAGLIKWAHYYKLPIVPDPLIHRQGSDEPGGLFGRAQNL